MPAFTFALDTARLAVAIWLALEILALVVPMVLVAACGSVSGFDVDWAHRLALLSAHQLRGGVPPSRDVLAVARRRGVPVWACVPVIASAWLISTVDSLYFGAVRARRDHVGLSIAHALYPVYGMWPLRVGLWYLLLLRALRRLNSSVSPLVFRSGSHRAAHDTQH